MTRRRRVRERVLWNRVVVRAERNDPSAVDILARFGRWGKRASRRKNKGVGK